jgi:hypothetical protein
MCYGDRIVVFPGQSPAAEFSTLVHELAHAFLHRAERRTTTTKTVRETETEAIAFVVGTTIGLHNGRASADYIGCILETPRYTLKVGKSSRRHPPSSSPHSKPHAAEPVAEAEPEQSKPPTAQHDDTGVMASPAALKKPA